MCCISFSGNIIQADFIYKGWFSFKMLQFIYYMYYCICLTHWLNQQNFSNFYLEFYFSMFKDFQPKGIGIGLVHSVCRCRENPNKQPMLITRVRRCNLKLDYNWLNFNRLKFTTIEYNVPINSPRARSARRAAAESIVSPVVSGSDWGGQSSSGTKSVEALALFH